VAETPVIYWYRQDLRVDDLPGLAAAASAGRPVLPCFILDDTLPERERPGGASRWWLHHSLAALAQDLGKLGLPLLLRRGAHADELAQLVAQTGAQTVYCSRRVEPAEAARERTLHEALAADGVTLKRYPGSLLFEPEAIRTQADAAYKVFTPFWKACLREPAPAAPAAAPDKPAAPATLPGSLSLDDLALLPRDPDWAGHWPRLWQPGTAGARAALQRFLENAIGDYDEGRNHPQREATSRLSPHLHFGEISPRAVWHAVTAHCQGQPDLEAQRHKFLSELGWREFSHYLLHHFPHIVEKPFKEEFSKFPWLGNEQLLRAWQRGMTGYPLVDAGMRELWRTGYMHNRVRMIVASFLTKHLLVHWRSGERWFHDTLVDADLANNTCGWQWVAGSGADAAPFFRIFNPTLQGKRFDAQGEYVRRWVPELAQLPDKHIHEPARAPQQVLAAAGVVLGETYPEPIVDHGQAREAALAAYGSIRSEA